MKQNNQALRLFSVCRVSSREQSEGYSLAAQDQANREWAERKGHGIVETIQYVETASKQKERQRFREIINRVCSDPTINGVVFHKVDRACRNLTDLAMLERLETEKNKKVFFSSQEFPQNAAGRLSIGVMGVVARWYTDNLKEEVNKGFRSKIEAGEYPHTPPYGYKTGYGPNGSKLPVPDPQKADIVSTIFELMASGNYSVDTLREVLFQRGMYFSDSTRMWTRSHLAKLLHHSFYIGKIPWRGQIYEGKHEPIVNEQTWQKVQEILDGRGNARCRKRREFTYGHGLIKCADCGYSVTAEVHKKQYTYYVCSQRRHLDHSVKPAWVPEPIIESQIVSMLGKLILPREIYDWAVEYLKHALAKEGVNTENELKTLKRRISEAQSTLDALLLKAAQADDSLTEGFMRLARQRQNETALLQQRFEQIKSGINENTRDPVRILELAQGLSEKYVTFRRPQKRQIAHSVFSNLALDGVTLCSEYRLPFVILAEYTKYPLNYARQDSNLRPPV